MSDYLNPIYRNMLDKYKCNSVVDHYLLGFAYYGKMYVIDANFELLSQVCVLDKASKGRGFSIRFRPTTETKFYLICRGAKLLPHYDEEQFLRECKIGKDSFGYNKGDVFENYIFSITGQKWEKNHKPFYTDPDIYIDGVPYQIKFERATICNESSLANLYPHMGDFRLLK